MRQQGAVACGAAGMADAAAGRGAEMKCTIAIDPGESGGIAWWDNDGIVFTAPMPDTPGGVLSTLRNILASMPAPATVALEKVGGYTGGTGQPGSAMFKFGQGYGFLQGALMAMGARIELVTPQVWQKALGLGTRDKAQPAAVWKRKLRSEAERLFPGANVTLKTADALLILEYAARAEKQKGGTP
jgi:hypothetical protein